MKLSKRLMEVAGFVTPGYTVSDIGTDHGYVPIYLIENGLADRVIAMDINRGPLMKAKQNISERGLADRIELRLSNGFEKLSAGEADIAVIAGMGGELIKRILINGQAVVNQLKELVLSPHSEIDVVRRYLHGAGFKIVKEKMLVDEGKYYTIIKAVRGKDRKYTEAEYRYGALLIEEKSEVLQEFLENKRNKYVRIIEKIEQGMSEQRTEELKNEYQDFGSVKRLAQIREEMAEIEETLGKLKVSFK